MAPKQELWLTSGRIFHSLPLFVPQPLACTASGLLRLSCLSPEPPPMLPSPQTSALRALDHRLLLSPLPFSSFLSHLPCAHRPHPMSHWELFLPPSSHVPPRAEEPSRVHNPFPLWPHEPHNLPKAPLSCLAGKSARPWSLRLPPSWVTPHQEPTSTFHLQDPEGPGVSGGASPCLFPHPTAPSPHTSVFPSSV